MSDSQQGVSWACQSHLPPSKPLSTIVYHGPTGKRIRKKYEAARKTNYDIQQEILRYLTMCLF